MLDAIVNYCRRALLPHLEELDVVAALRAAHNLLASHHQVVRVAVALRRENEAEGSTVVLLWCGYVCIVARSIISHRQSRRSPPPYRTVGVGHGVEWPDAQRKLVQDVKVRVVLWGGWGEGFTSKLTTGLH